MKNFFLDPQVSNPPSGGGQGSLTRDTAPSQFQEAEMPAEMKGAEINFDEVASNAKSPNVPPAAEQDADEVEFNAEKLPPKTEQEAQTKQPETKAEKGKLPDVNITPKKEVAPVVTPAPEKKEVPKGSRDFSIFDPADVATAKATNNQQFELLKKLALSSKDTGDKLKVAQDKLDSIAKDPNAIPQDWHNHPEAYVLHPQFKSAYNRLNTLQFEAEHYKEQVIKIKSNEKWTTITGYDAQGNPLYSAPQEPSATAETNCLNFMNEGNRLVQQTQAGIQQFANTFQQRYGQAQKYVEEIIEQKWPWAKDDKHASQKYVKEFYSAVPDEFHNHPSTRVSALMWATIRELATELDSLRTKDATGKRLEEVTARTEPKVANTDVPSDGAKPKAKFGKSGQYVPPEVFTMD